MFTNAGYLDALDEASRDDSINKMNYSDDVKQQMKEIGRMDASGIISIS